MKTQDVDAINRMDPKNSMYLAVVGKNAEEHLIPIQQGRWGKFCMMLGCSSASMRKVIDYIERHQNEFNARPSALNYTKFNFLQEKIISFRQKHKPLTFVGIWNALIARIQNIFSSTSNKTTKDPVILNKTTKDPVKATNTPIPIKTTNVPVKTTNPPIPIKTTKDPVKATNTPIPIKTTNVPVKTTNPPIPIKTTKDPVKATNTPIPIKTTKDPVKTTNPPISIPLSPPPNNNLDDFERLDDKFIRSATEQPKIANPDFLHELFDQECVKFQTFLQTQLLATKSSDDLIYICMGHGNVEEQIWPGFVLNALQNGQKVRTLLIEYLVKHPREEAASKGLQKQYAKYPLCNSNLQKNLDNFSVEQFLCGMPYSTSEALDTIPPDKRWLYEKEGPMYPSNFYWSQQNQIQNVQNNFPLYIEKMLSQGKRVVIADHSGALGLQEPLVKTYNDLLIKYPQQLYFLWGWGGINCMTHQPITPGDVDSEIGSPIWKKFPRENLGLNRCELFT